MKSNNDSQICYQNPENDKQKDLKIQESDNQQNLIKDEVILTTQHNNFDSGPFNKQIQKNGVFEDQIIFNQKLKGQSDENQNRVLEQTENCATIPNPDGFFADTQNQAACSVRVALRVRPLIKKEMFEKQIVQASPEQNTVQIGQEKLFTFDACFDQQSVQEAVFEKCVKNLVLGCFQGFNATVLAYGQTGSGKTWTMGSGYTIGLSEDEFGIIPRVIRLIFQEKEKRSKQAEFTIKCSFLEIYNEELIDLLDPNGLQQAIQTGEKNNKINIREEKNGQIAVYGLHEQKVENVDEMASCLDRGSNVRTTASTLMNNNSSRSHAIFTILIEQHQIDQIYENSNVDSSNTTTGLCQDQNGGLQQAQNEYMVAKFHFVDLAGSERAKKTGAVGATLKEGININKSLLVLGNVISALSDEGKKGNFVPYRDSKLTRILQDSLGGNSRTSMIACVSPAESNFDETLNCLNYASRARKIKNKPKINRDPNSILIDELRRQCLEVQKECLNFRRLLTINQIEFQQIIELPSEEELSKKMQILDAGGVKQISSMNSYEIGLSGQEIRSLEEEIKKLKIENIQKEKISQNYKIINESLQSQLSETKIECYSNCSQKDSIRLQLDQLNQILEIMNLKEKVYSELFQKQNAQGENYETDIFGMNSTILEEYQKQLKEMKIEVDEKKLQITQLQNHQDELLKQSDQDQIVLEKQSQEIEKLKRNNAKLQKENIQLQNDLRNTNKLGKAVNQTNERSISNGPKNKLNSASIDLKSKSRARAIKSNLKSNYISQEPQLPNFSTSDFANDFTLDLEAKMKNFNDKFMENISKSLTEQLFDISKAAELKRKKTIGQSFIEKGPVANSFIGGIFGTPKREEKNLINNFNISNQNQFGEIQIKQQINNFSSSVLIPGIQNDFKKKEMLQINLKKQNTQQIDKDRIDLRDAKLSMIQDTETINECDTVQDENINGSSEEGQNQKKVPAGEKSGMGRSTIMYHDDPFEKLKQSINQRASLIEAQRRSMAASTLTNKYQNAYVDHNNAQGPIDEQDVIVIQEINNEQDINSHSNFQIQSHPFEEQFEEIAIQEMSSEKKMNFNWKLNKSKIDSQSQSLRDSESGDDDNDIYQDDEKHEIIINEELLQLNGNLVEKEKLLDAIKEQQKQMQNELVELMKNQYQQKVLQLTNEITQLEKAKQSVAQDKNSLSVNPIQKKKIEEQFLQKQQQLEKELKEVKVKNMQQMTMKKHVDSQSLKIKSLESEIQKIKTQKISTHRKWKEELEKYNKLRKLRADELLNMKKANSKKDFVIDQLKKEAKMKDLLNKRKIEEIKVLQIQKNLNFQKQDNAKKMRQEKLDINKNKIKEWIQSNLDKMIKIYDGEQDLLKQNKNLEEVLAEINDEIVQKASLELIKEKLFVKKYLLEGQPEENQELEELFIIDSEIERIELQIDQLQININNLSEKQDYINAEISEIMTELMKTSMESEGSLGKQGHLSSQEGIKSVVDSFFQILREAHQKLKQLQTDIEQSICNYEQLQEDYQTQQQIIEVNEQYYYAKIQNIEKECQQRELILSQLQESMKLEDDDLKGKQNYHLGQNLSTKEFQQRVLSAKEEIQKQKESAISESIMFLRKRVVELEKMNTEKEKHDQMIQNKLKNALQEKEQQKMQISQLKNQIKLLNDLSSDINQRNAIQGSYGIGSNSQVSVQINSFYSQISNITQSNSVLTQSNTLQPSGKRQASLSQNNRFTSLAERRNDIKFNKKQVSVNEQDVDQLENIQIDNYEELSVQFSPNKEQQIKKLDFQEQSIEDNLLMPQIITQQKKQLNQEVGISSQEFSKQKEENKFEYQQESPQTLNEYSNEYSNIYQQENLKIQKKNTHLYSSEKLKSQFTNNNNVSQFSQRKQSGMSQNNSNLLQNNQNLFRQKTNISQRKVSEYKNRRQVRKVDQPVLQEQNSLRFQNISQKIVSVGSQSNLNNQAQKESRLDKRKMSDAKPQKPQLLQQQLLMHPGNVIETVYNSNRDKKQSFDTEIMDDQFSNEQNSIQQIGSFESNSRLIAGSYASGHVQKQVQRSQKPQHNQASWKIQKTVEDAHLHQIFDIAYDQNKVFSTSQKSLKLWDINTMQMLANIQAHQGAIKCVKILQGCNEKGQSEGEQYSQSIFVTAGDKNDKILHIWDKNTLTNQASLRGHKGEIRAIEFSKDGKYLFSAGQGGMLVWDLRNTDQPIELIEKHMDIFALKSTDQQLFMGCRNHSIIPMSLKKTELFQEQVLPPVKQPHFDIVTSFSFLFNQKILVSSSKDKQLRAWNIHQGPQLELKFQKNLTIKDAHQDHINILQQSKNGMEMYSGSKDGVVKIWNLKSQNQVDDDQLREDEDCIDNLYLKQVAQLSAQGGSINAIQAIDNGNQSRMIIYGGQNKSLRICKRIINYDDSNEQDNSFDNNFK